MANRLVSLWSAKLWKHLTIIEFSWYSLSKNKKNLNYWDQHLLPWFGVRDDRPRQLFNTVCFLKPREDTPGNGFFEISSCASAFVRRNYQETRGKFIWEYLVLACIVNWTELNVLASTTLLWSSRDSLHVVVPSPSRKKVFPSRGEHAYTNYQSAGHCVRFIVTTITIFWRVTIEKQFCFFKMNLLTQVTSADVS